ncbi:MAG: single-stranded DNA-binding protein [Lawsonibacter sp.]|nr:single-stranded DNA-binding protein [Lawsonibacter sp.]
MLNRIIIMGRLARDPELRRTQAGVPVASFRLAVDRDFKDKSTGERATDWIDVVAWRQTGEFVSRYFTRGRMAVVEGRLQMRDWTDKDGNKRTSAEVVADNVYFGDSKRDGDGAPSGSYSPARSGGYAQSQGEGGYPSAPSYGAPPSYGGAPAEGDQFRELTGDTDDGELPF